VRDLPHKKCDYRRLPWAGAAASTNTGIEVVFTGNCDGGTDPVLVQLQRSGSASLAGVSVTAPNGQVPSTCSP
jgi:hypothetical protein